MENIFFEWKDEYNIGVEEIDTAHRRLFSVVNRIISNLTQSNFEKSKTTCIEAIKYLKSYALKHFGEEEAYQLRIKYPGYKTHRKIHDNMRDVVIPALEKEVISKSYSRESLEHFVGTCAGWLAAHVLVADMAIVGKAKNKWNSDIDTNSENLLDAIVKECIFDLFHFKAEISNRNYTGFTLNKLFCYRSVFTLANGTEYAVVSAIEHSMLKAAIMGLVSSELDKVDDMNDLMLSMVSEIFKSFNFTIASQFLKKSLTRKEEAVISEDGFYRIFSNVYPDYSMLWRTNDGYIVFAFRKIQ